MGQEGELPEAKGTSLPANLTLRKTRREFELEGQPA
jgi:hypothetical protein